MKKYDYVVIGAGIIGTHCAWQIHLRKPDAKILVLDNTLEQYDNASCGNMAGFATCEVQPLSTIGNMMRAFKWMLDPLAPFTLRPTKIPTFMPWLRGFFQSAFTPGHYAHVIKSQEMLMSRAHKAHLDIIGDTPLKNLISKKGALCIYRNSKRMERDWATRWKLFRDRGEEAYILSKSELKDRLPHLSSEINLAIEVPSILHWKNPQHLLSGLHVMARETGITFRQEHAAKITVNDPSNITITTDTQNCFKTASLIVAAGAWSANLAEQLGDTIPLSTERGYNTTIPVPNVDVDNLLLFPDDEFVATPMNIGLRLGGTVELAGLKAPPNFKRTDALAKNITKYFPTITLDNRTEWMGHRPSMPDGLPVISRAKNNENIYYAFGHGHVGVTQSAITGKIIANLICREKPDFDISPFSVKRC